MRSEVAWRLPSSLSLLHGTLLEIQSLDNLGHVVASDILTCDFESDESFSELDASVDGKTEQYVGSLPKPPVSSTMLTSFSSSAFT